MILKQEITVESKTNYNLKGLCSQYFLETTSGIIEKSYFKNYNNRGT